MVEPHYRAYYSGPLADELAARLERRQSHYPTYLGSAFCLTVPEFLGIRAAEQVRQTHQELGRRSLLAQVLFCAGQTQIIAGA